MVCAKCGGGKGRCGLCPITLGLSIGITCFLMVFAWALWIVYHDAGVLPAPVPAFMHEKILTVMEGLKMGGFGFVKGFIFGFLVALIYDVIKKACACCRGKSGESCECEKKPEVKAIK